MNDILRYTLKRLSIGLLTVIVITMLVFVLIRLIPGDAVERMQPPGETFTEAQKEALREKWGLNDPIHIQYISWVKNVLNGDMGQSFSGGRDVATELRENLPYTLTLAIFSMAVTWLLAIPLGILTAFRHNRFIDRFLIITTTIISSMPGFWKALLLILLFSVQLGLLPFGGYEGPISFVLPVIANALGFGGLMRITRSEILNTMNEDFVTTAYAKGLTKKRVVVAHVLRNSIIPITVMVFMGLPSVIGGSVIIETIFSLPGTGTYLLQAINALDYQVIQIVVLILAVLTVTFNTLGDIAVALLDPRARMALKRGV